MFCIPLNISFFIILRKEIEKLMADDEVTSKKGIYKYILDGQEKHLNLRAFDKNTAKTMYAKQQGHCPDCDKKSLVILTHKVKQVRFMAQIPTNLIKCKLIILSRGLKAAKPNYATAKCFASGIMNIRVTIRKKLYCVKKKGGRTLLVPPFFCIYFYFL